MRLFKYIGNLFISLGEGIQNYRSYKSGKVK